MISIHFELKLKISYEFAKLQQKVDSQITEGRKQKEYIEYFKMEQVF